MVEWMLRFTTCRIHHLDAFHSDHKPIFLISDSEQKRFYRKGRPFRFEAMWLKDNSCEEMVKNSWQEVSDPSPICMVTKQIINCQDNLRIWNRDTFGHVRLSLAKKLKELKGVEERGLYRSDPTHVHQLRVDIQALMSKEETMWKQRSHVEWLKEGDQNTRYFHCRANQGKWLWSILPISSLLQTHRVLMRFLRVCFPQ